jgi:hypothetical protein
VTKHSTRFTLMAFAAAVAGVVPIVAAGLTPVNGSLVGGTTTIVDNSPGQQLDPHVSGDLAAYTDENGGSPIIRFYDFLDPASSARSHLVPQATATRCLT